MTGECDGCGRLADVVAIYEGDDPSTGYKGSSEPEFLCWECRHPSAPQMIAAEQRANELAMRLLGVDPDEPARKSATAHNPPVATETNRHSAYPTPEDALNPEPFDQLTLEEKLVASIAVANYRKENVA